MGEDEDRGRIGSEGFCRPANRGGGGRKPAFSLHREKRRTGELPQWRRGSGRTPANGTSQSSHLSPAFPTGVSSVAVAGSRCQTTSLAARRSGATGNRAHEGILAVFRYDVPQDESNYDVQYCCFTSGKTWDFSGKELWNVYESLTPAYHGEIAVDPQTGAIFRLTVKTDIPDGQPIYGAKVLVEYGPVELGGREYLLPTKSVSISVAPVPVMVQDAHCTDGACTHGLFVHPKDTVVRDTVYTSYHAFRGDTRILSTDASDTDDNSPSSTQPQPGTPRKQP